MNWVGGARNRIRVKDDKRQQRDFFEKRRFSKHIQHLHPSSPGQRKAKGAISQDLVFLQALNNATARPRNARTAQQGPSTVAVDLDSSKKRRMDIFLPNVSPDLASIPSRLDLQEDTTLDRGKKEDSVMGHSTTEEPLPKFLRDLENARMVTPESTHPICYSTEDERVTPFLEELLNKKPLFYPDTPYNPYSAPGPASLKRRQQHTKECLSPVAGTVPEDLYVHNLDIKSAHNNWKKNRRRVLSDDRASLPTKSHIPQTEMQHYSQSKPHRMFKEPINSHRQTAATHEHNGIINHHQLLTQNAGGEEKVSSFQRMLLEFESMQKPPDSLNTQTNISRDVGQLVGQHSKWRDFVTRQEPTVVAEPHGSPLRDELLAEEALEELMKLSEASGSGDEGGHSSDWSNSTFASHHSKRPKDDISNPAHSSADHNKEFETKPTLTHSTQSRQLYQLKSETEDQSKIDKHHIQCIGQKFQEAATQTSKEVTRDVSTQSTQSLVKTRSIAIQTDSPEIPQHSLEIRDHQQHPLLLNPSNHIRLPFPAYPQLEAALTGRYAQAPFLPPPAVVWQSVVTKVIATTLSSSVSHAPSLPLSEQEQPSISDNETDSCNGCKNMLPL